MVAASRSRLIIDLPPELARRVRRAAVQEEASLSDYVSRLLDRMVPRMDEEGSGFVTREQIDAMRAVTERIMRGRVFTDDSADIIREMRDERTAELP